MGRQPWLLQILGDLRHVIGRASTVAKRFAEPCIPRVFTRRETTVNPIFPRIADLTIPASFSECLSRISLPSVQWEQHSRPLDGLNIKITMVLLCSVQDG